MPESYNIINNTLDFIKVCSIANCACASFSCYKFELRNNNKVAIVDLEINSDLLVLERDELILHVKNKSLILRNTDTFNDSAYQKLKMFLGIN